MLEKFSAILAGLWFGHGRGVVIMGGFCLFVLFLFGSMCREESKADKRKAEEGKSGQGHAE